MATPTPGPVGARTVLDIVRLSTAYLNDHGSESARLDAELLVAHALGIARLDVYLQYDRPLDDPELGAIRELLRRRGRGEPVAHLTGRREFHGRSFRVSPDVLIPRPETETLVERALVAARERNGALRIADLGTGSGCLAISLACELPAATVIAVDVSPGGPGGGGRERRGPGGRRSRPLRRGGLGGRAGGRSRPGGEQPPVRDQR